MAIESDRWAEARPEAPFGPMSPATPTDALQPAMAWLQLKPCRAAPALPERRPGELQLKHIEPRPESACNSAI